MMECLWFKFQHIRAVFGGKKAKKLPKKGYLMDAALPRKHLKISNLGTTNVMLMKLTTSMYHHENFHWEKNWGVNHRA